MPDRKNLTFKPFFGLSSKHLQMIVPRLFSRERAFASTQHLVEIGNGDKLSCEISTPSNWVKTSKTIVLIHGLGGSHLSDYMVRIARKLYEKDNKVVRINLRNCGSGKGLSKLPYNAGNSRDVLEVLQFLKKSAPSSNIYVVGFSLGGNIALKLAGELSFEAKSFVNTFIAICPPFDLESTVHLIDKRKIYLQYYLKNILEQSIPWTSQKFQSLYEFDDKVTGPIWSYTGAKDYYQNCSCKHFLNKICVATHILCAEDDPFVSIDHLENCFLSNHIQLWTTKYGSHMGFLGREKFRWLDHLLLNWIDGNFEEYS